MSAIRTGTASAGTGSAANPDDAIAVVAQQSPTNVDSIVFHPCTGSPALPNPLLQLGRGLRVRLRPGVAGDFLLSQPHF